MVADTAVEMLAEWSALVTLVMVAGAEWLHSRRSRRLQRLAFGPTERPSAWVTAAPWLRTAACTLACWGLVTLLLMDPKIHSRHEVDPAKQKHLLLVMDVSPSMYLEDAGPEKNISRRKRASDVLISLFNRLPMREYRVSLIAFYTDAKPLLEETTDIEIIRHIVEELPIFLGFKPGKSDLFAGLQMASQIARPWNPNSATVVVMTDGMTVPPSGMPRMPPAVHQVLVVGVGDPHAGRFIDGHQSRQDVANLRQIANRLQGVYHDGNAKHIPTTTIYSITHQADDAPWLDFTRRELALAALALGAAILALLPIALHFFGTSWRPGVKMASGTTQWNY